MTSKRPAKRGAKGLRRASARPAARATARPRDPQRVADLFPDPANRRKRTPRNVAMIASALRDVGAARSIVIDEANEILAGNGVAEAAAQAGISKLRIVDADGDTIIAVRRRGLTADQKRSLAIYDNRTAELAEWNVDQLQTDAATGVDLAPFFFEKELDQLFKRAGAAAPGVVGGVAQFVIIVTCQTEEAQTELLERFLQEGLECRAVVS